MTDQLSWQHRIRTEPDGIVVVLDGEIDVNGAAALLSLLDATIDSAQQVLVDLHAVQFIDSTVISVLITARHIATGAGKRFGVVNPTGNVARTLRVTGVLDALSPSRA
ncbi:MULTISPECIES: STAS domain-containing protein [Micromonospora]|jgi:anti-anti-sigma factor|uniref:Anti-sigma factor antagonist n=1 Tax=Micromonospora sicca TaxID=2202420 RepID=A0A317DNS2_9ACTN|nr:MULTISPECIES: STAS domain-containing protein [unclassified Micromonospora]MBM0225150.1 STAS domain-containing protein [Micromonospora sp. ATA51]PWR16419.1 anti-sigma factor antagonist [Micromonospora sp. 4G51]